jgi:hypothetical protein
MYLQHALVMASACVCLLCCRCFSDGFPDLFVHHATEIRNRHVGFLASFHDPGKIFEQISIIYALPRLFIGSFTLVLPFFPTGTAERVRGMGVWLSTLSHQATAQEQPLSG